MRRTKGFLLIAATVAMCSMAFAQTPAVTIPLTISDGVASRTLYFGLDPTATDGIDLALGESEQPPLPPRGIFEARFIGTDISIPIGEGLLKDYRQGSTSTQGARIHELYFQVGSGTTIQISWSLPAGITGRLQDLFTGTIINVVMSGTGSYTVSNPNTFSKLKMTVTYSFTNSVTENDEVPTEFVLYQNYPNPFSGSTVIGYEIAEVRGQKSEDGDQRSEDGGRKTGCERVSLKVYDILGREVAILVDGIAEGPGFGYARFDANHLAGGVYFYRLEANGIVRREIFHQTKKMLLLK